MPGRQSIVERRLSAFLAKRGLRGVSILVAVSGGADSTALLLAARASAPGLGLRIHAAWVDHGIRPAPERENERAFVEDLCARLGIPCEASPAPSEALVERSARLGTSLEAEARGYRYAVLEAAARRFGCERVLTAHTRDDQAETLLIRILSGSGTAGLRGIPVDRPPFLRPFLTLPKRMLIRYLRERGEVWSEDSTNAGEDYLRNRIRRRLIPSVERVLPGFRKALAALAEKSRLDEDLLSAMTERELPALREQGQSSFSAAEFRAAHPALRIRALTHEAGRLAAAGRRVPYALVRSAAVSYAGSIGASGPRILAQGMGLRFLEDGDRVRVVSLVSRQTEDRSSGDFRESGRNVTFAAGYSFLFERPGTLRIDTGGSCTVYFREGAAGPAEGTFEFPLTIRSRLPGDQLAIRGGRKPLDEVLADLSILRERRDLVPVLVDRLGIVGVLGSAAGSRNRFRPGPDPLDPSRLRLDVEITGIGPFR